MARGARLVSERHRETDEQTENRIRSPTKEPFLSGVLFPDSEKIAEARNTKVTVCDPDVLRRVIVE